MDNKERYDRERGKRWAMAENKEPEAIKVICRMLSSALSCVVDSDRYDDIWFKKFDLSLPENEWVKGASDYVIRITGQKYIYAEIKIKSVKFHKTVEGGKTKKGSVITAYGCESFYLDIVPVYKNMCRFVERTQIDSDSFILFFVNEDMSEIHAISLKEIQDLIRSGYRSKPICKFSEGYGTDTEYGAAPNYLIPVDCTHKIDINIGEYIKRHSTPQFITEIDRCVFAYKSGFYHRSRDCKFIKNKPDGEIIKFTDEEAAAKAGYTPCRICVKISSRTW